MGSRGRDARALGLAALVGAAAALVALAALAVAVGLLVAPWAGFATVAVATLPLALACLGPVARAWREGGEGDGQEG